MKKPARVTATLIEKFATLSDPRIERTKKHSMTDILVISICGVDNWVDLEEFAEIRQDWFKTSSRRAGTCQTHEVHLGYV